MCCLQTLFISTASKGRLPVGSLLQEAHSTTPYRAQRDVLAMSCIQDTVFSCKIHTRPKRIPPILFPFEPTLINNQKASVKVKAWLCCFYTALVFPSSVCVGLSLPSLRHLEVIRARLCLMVSVLVLTAGLLSAEPQRKALATNNQPGLRTQCSLVTSLYLQPPSAVKHLFISVSSF